MGLIDGYTKILQGFTEGQDVFQINPEFHDKQLKRNPLYRIFLDSDFNSDIETAVKKMRVDSHISSIRHKLPEGKISEKLSIFIGSRIANAENSLLDRYKAFYKLKKGQISLDQYQNIRATQIQASIVNTYKKTKWMARKAIATLFGFDDDSSTESKVGFGFIIRKGEKLVEKALSSETSKKIIKASVATVHAGIAAVKKAYNTVKECLVDPVVNTVGKAVKKTAEAIVDFGHKAKEVVGKVINKTEVEWNLLKEDPKKYLVEKKNKFVSWFKKHI